MKRKLVQQGPTTLMTSLPREWVVRHNLQKGSAVNIADNGNSLLIVPHAEVAQKVINLDFQGSSASAIRIALTNAYRGGYDLFHVTLSHKDDLKKVRDAINNYMIGLEVSDYKDNKCTLEIITEPTAEQFDKIFSKILLNFHQLVLHTGDRLNGEEGASNYSHSAFNIHKFDNFCRRILVNQSSRRDTVMFYWNFLSVLMHASRELYHLNTYLDSTASQLNDKKIIDALVSLSELLQKAYLRKDRALAETISHKQDQLINKTLLVSLKKGKEDPVVLHRISNIVRNVHYCTSPLVGLIVCDFIL